MGITMFLIKVSQPHPDLLKRAQDFPTAHGSKSFENAN